MRTTRKKEISETITRRFTPQPIAPTPPKLVIQYLCNACNQREIATDGYCSTCGVRKTASSDWANTFRIAIVTAILVLGSLGFFALLISMFGR